MLGNPLYAAPDRFTLQSVETGLRGLSEDEKRLVGISTISVVTRLALEFGMEEVSNTFIFNRLRTHLPCPGDGTYRIDAPAALTLCGTDSGSSHCI